jgi:6-pyruvoyltetrahydropterin/6-carboxytetrahydropterin synthase
VRAAVDEAWASFPGGETLRLREALGRCIAPLDYQYLNKVLPVPTDENLCRWVRDRIDVPAIQSIGVESTRDEGVNVSRNGEAHVWRRYAFKAAHRLPHVPAGHKCGNMHGHGFEVIVHVAQGVDGRDMGVDYDHIDACMAPLIAQLDYACLNQIAGLENPTSELIARWIWDRLSGSLDHLTWVSVYETASCGATFDGARYRIWKDTTLDSAVRLRDAPNECPAYQLHGATYTLRLQLDAPLDEVMGWTIDFGDVKDLFMPIFKRLDHRAIHEIPGIESGDVATMLRWIRTEAAPCIPHVDTVELYEREACGAALYTGACGPALPAA